MNIIRYF